MNQLEQHAVRVEQLFAEIDYDTAQFEKASGIRCPKQCGKCCENPKIETTVLDLLPLALSLKREGRLNEVADKAAVAGAAHCVFFERYETIGLGRCTVYRYRPSICRLFGFAATRDKHNIPQLAACKVHSSTQPDVMEKTKIEVSSGRVRAPLFTTYAQQLTEIDPTLAMRHLQINQAVLAAIEKVALLPS